MAITLKTGLDTLDINYAEHPEEHFSISFNSKDPQFVRKLQVFNSELRAKSKEVIELKEQAEAEAQVEAINTIADIICEELDKVFAKPISKDVFRYCGPFAQVDGTFFILAFFEAVTPEIEAILQKSLESVQAKMAKHTGKYNG